MVNAILRFASCCRTAGYRVSTSEVLDCVSQLELVDIFDEAEFRAVLRANFAKSRREQAHFDQLYHLFFHEMRQDINLDEADPVSDKIDEVIKSLEQQNHISRTHQAILDFLSGNPMSFLEIMRMLQTEEIEMAQGRKFNLGPLASRLEVMVQLNDVRGEIDRFLDKNPLHYALKTRQELGRRFNKQLENAYALLLKEPRPYNEGLKEVKTHDQYLRQLGERPFTSLTQKELEQVREIIDKLVRKLKDIIARRYAA
ncbi:MAG TPA: hypothetical protein PLM29_12685, partial [Deltaproteobacteria bacterium]|nr:hypothetical protein [Deltaproteobacteria bacterium]